MNKAPFPAAPLVAIVLKGYPRLSETFIAQEILALERLGADLCLISLRHPTDDARHPVHDEISAPVTYLPEYLWHAPRRVLRGWRGARRLAGYRRAVAQWWRDLARDPSPNRIRRLGQAMVLAHELPGEVGHLHAHFLHTPASVARYAAMMRAIPWSCSAHAKDIWTTPEWEKREKLADVSWAVTCTAANRAHLAALSDRPETVSLAYHGLDFQRFSAPAPAPAAARDGTDARAPVDILCVGRAVPKKGIDVLLAALARLPDSVHWRLCHVGGGPLLPRLRKQAAAAGIDGRIEWAGAQAQAQVLARYRAADLFVLPCRVAADGDRDGLPNVLMEAQSQGLACISTPVSAIPELIDDGRTGVLVAPDDAEALAAALAQMIAGPERRRALGQAALERVRRDFPSGRGIGTIARHFGLAAAPSEAPPARSGTGAG